MCKVIKNKIVNDDDENKNFRYGLNTRVKSTKVGLKETGSNNTCTRVTRKKLYEFSSIIRSYKVQ